MSSEETTLRLAGVSKCYHVYAQKHHRLLQTLLSGRKQFYKEFWALRDIGLEIRRGECMGIIGRNGSGKSTLLQIIAGTLAPTTGEVEVRGRIAALLELGSGFNPEATGRENVFLNGTVLGMSNRQIKAKFDQIAEFADIGDFIEQPIKTYSSGMVVRLAFGVQVMMEPDILIVDEALAVGDAAFQMKCMAHIQRLIDGGTTVLLVSHSVQVVRTFCQHAIWLHQGQIRQMGDAASVTSEYMEFLFSGQNVADRSKALKQQAGGDLRLEGQAMMPVDFPGRKDPLRRWGSGEARITHFSIAGEKSGMTGMYEHLEHLTVNFEVEIAAPVPADAVSVGVALRDTRGIDVLAVSSAERRIFWTDLAVGNHFISTFEFDNILNPGEYMLILAVEYFIEGQRKYSDYIENVFLVQAVSDRKHYGIVEPRINLKIAKVVSNGQHEYSSVD